MERFGKFEILERIGEGGMAEIFLAKPLDASVSKLVAIKRILPQLIDDPSYQTMFRTEGAIAMRFRHQAIIAVYEMGAVDGQDYMSMEYFPGKPVAQIMSRLRDTGHKLAILDRVVIIKEIAEALHYIHAFSDYGGSAEIIHRDISPHNIMVGFNGATKLIDFGIAKVATNDTTQAKVLKGKVAYMSPEQVRGDRLNHQTDVFSLGIVFWELLAQKKLFTGKTVQELAAKIKACRVPSVADLDPDIPPELNRICLKALTEPLSIRYQTAGELAADLNDFLRVMSASSRERSLADSMRKLFPEELDDLKDQLKIHEGMQEGVLRAEATGKTPWKGVEKAAPSKSRSRSRRKKPFDWNIPAATLAVFLALGMLYRSGLRPSAIFSAMRPPSAVAEAPRTQVSPPASATMERKPAAENEASALLTVHANPTSRLWVNGRLIKNSNVTNMKIPVGKQVIIKVLRKGARKAKIRKFTPTPFSRNVFEMGG